jgi:hypothetical protein
VEALEKAASGSENFDFDRMSDDDFLQLVRAGLFK